MSLYDYAGGDPINYVDPTGRIQSPQVEKPWYAKLYDEVENLALRQQDNVGKSDNPIAKAIHGWKALKLAGLQGGLIGISIIADQWSFQSSAELHEFSKGTGFDNQASRVSSNIAAGSIAAIGSIYVGSAAIAYGGMFWQTPRQFTQCIP